MYKLLVALHLLGASVWIGGHIVLSAAILPRALRARDPSIVLSFESGFERVGLPALLLQVVTGLWLAYRWVPDVSRWFAADAQLPALIATKLALLAATVLLALHARLRVIPHLRPATLPLLAYHIVAVTVISLGFLIVGVGIRTGGIF